MKQGRGSLKSKGETVFTRGQMISVWEGSAIQYVLGEF